MFRADKGDANELDDMSADERRLLGAPMARVCTERSVDLVASGVLFLFPITLLAILL